MEKHFVTFLSPGTFISEESTRPINTWNIEVAINMSKNITERHSAIPYGFYFTTRSRTNDELDSKVTKTSHKYFLGGKVSTLEEIENRNNREDRILISNMRCNGYSRVIETTKGWKCTHPLKDEDIVLAEQST